MPLNLGCVESFSVQTLCLLCLHFAFLHFRELEMECNSILSPSFGLLAFIQTSYFPFEIQWPIKLALHYFLKSYYVLITGPVVWHLPRQVF